MSNVKFRGRYSFCLIVFHTSIFSYNILPQFSHGVCFSYYSFLFKIYRSRIYRYLIEKVHICVFFNVEQFNVFHVKKLCGKIVPHSQAAHWCLYTGPKTPVAGQKPVWSRLFEMPIFLPIPMLKPQSGLAVCRAGLSKSRSQAAAASLKLSQEIICTEKRLY